MSIADLKARMRDIPGIETLTQSIQNGQQIFTLNGRTVTFGAGDSEATVEQGIRAAVAAPALVQMAAGAPVTPDVAANAAVALHPALQAVQVSPVSNPSPAPAPSTPGAHALTIKDMLSAHSAKLDQILQAQMAALQGVLDEQVNTVVDGVGAVTARVKGHTDDFKAILGQFTNQLEGLK